MGEDDPQTVTLRRSTIVRAGIVVALLAALGIGFAIGYLVHSPTSTPTGSAATTTTTAATPTTTQLPGVAVASCSGGRNTPIRPTVIFIGCATSNTTVTKITWSSWGVSSAQGTGTFNANNCQPDCAQGTFTSVPASIVVSNPAGGFFQTVTVTPTSGGLAPAYADMPGSGWGSG